MLRQLWDADACCQDGGNAAASAGELTAATQLCVRLTLRALGLTPTRETMPCPPELRIQHAAALQHFALRVLAMRALDRHPARTELLGALLGSGARGWWRLVSALGTADADGLDAAAALRAAARVDSDGFEQRLLLNLLRLEDSPLQVTEKTFPSRHKHARFEGAPNRRRLVPGATRSSRLTQSRSFACCGCSASVCPSTSSFGRPPRASFQEAMMRMTSSCTAAPTGE